MTLGQDLDAIDRVSRGEANQLPTVGDRSSPSGRQEILRDGLNVWARGVLQGRSLPSEAPDLLSRAPDTGYFL